jgi:hypothetical protein
VREWELQTMEAKKTALERYSFPPALQSDRSQCQNVDQALHLIEERIQPQD